MRQSSHHRTKCMRQAKKHLSVSRWRKDENYYSQPTALQMMNGCGLVGNVRRPSTPQGRATSTLTRQIYIISGEGSWVGRCYALSHWASSKNDTKKMRWKKISQKYDVTTCYSDGSGKPHRLHTDRVIVFAIWRQCALTAIIQSVVTRDSAANGHLDRLSRFCRARRCARHTGSQTTERATSVAIGRICAVHAMHA